MTHRSVLPLLAVAVIGASIPLAARAAGPTFWDYPQPRPFTQMQMRGAAVDEMGRLVPGLSSRAALADSSRVYWRAAPVKGGGFLVASGHDGQIWRLQDDGTSSLLVKLPVTEVFSLLPDGKGGVIAGCGPQGQVYVVEHDGTYHQRGEVEGGYVWALDVGKDGATYLAAGSPAAVYRLPAKGDVEKVVTLPASNALDLVVDTDGRLLVSTQGPGRVFAVDPQGKRAPQLLLEIDQDEARQILRGPDGWYVLGLASDQDQNQNSGDTSSSGKKSKGSDGSGFGADAPMVVTPDGGLGVVHSALYALAEGGVPQRIWASDRELMIAAWSDDWGWIGAGKRDEGEPTTLLGLTLPTAVRPLATWEGGDVLDIQVAGPHIAVCQAHPGLVTLLAPAKRDGEAISAPLDGDVPVRWGRLRWTKGTPGTSVRFAVRTGASATPDTTWSSWHDLDGGADVAIDVPPSRYLQWRATFTGGDARARIDEVSVSGFAPNLPPQITIFELQSPGSIVSGPMLSGNDNATQTFPSGLKVEYSTTSRTDRRLDHDRAAALRPLRTFAWHATDPNQDRLEFRLEYRRDGDTAWRPVADPTSDPVLTWDTSEVPDGTYSVRLRASDAPDNPAALAAEADRTLPDIEVDNTPPVITDLLVTATPTGLALRLRASDDLGPLAGASVMLPDGTSERLDPSDGICDSKVEEFRSDLVFPRPDSQVAVKPWRVRVSVWDLAGNVGVASGTLP